MTPTPIEYKMADGVVLRGDTYGDAANPPVLLLHGGGQTRHAWGGAAVALAKAGFYAVALDQRGHGDSDWAPGGLYRIGDFAADMRTVAQTFGTLPASVGASLGGLATMLGCGEADDPSAIARAIVLVDITPTVERAGVERIVNFMQEKMHEGFATLDDVADYVAAYLPDRPRPKSTAGLEKNLRQRDGRWHWHWDPGFMTDLGARMEDRDPERMKAATRRLSMPALLVRGAKSDLVTPETAKEFVDLAPKGQFVDVGGAGHMVAGDKNDVFIDAVMGFLAQSGRDNSDNAA
jgi:pimeloyl-ACP methyl ester carboxylesterase